MIGIDISHWNISMNWHTAKERGVSFAFIKATDGIARDACFETFWRGAKEAGIPRGAYHFFRPERAAAEQAHVFTQTVYERGELPPALDLEAKPKVGVSTYHAGVLAYLHEMEAWYHRRPIIYTSPSFIRTYLQFPAFQAYPLWIAHYNTAAPLVPPPFTEWAIWQTCEYPWGAWFGAGSRKVDIDVCHDIQSLLS